MKIFPKLDAMMVKGGVRTRRRRQTPDQMLAIAKVMAGMSFPEVKSKV